MKSALNLNIYQSFNKISGVVEALFVHSNNKTFRSIIFYLFIDALKVGK